MATVKTVRFCGCFISSNVDIVEFQMDVFARVNKLRVTFEWSYPGDGERGILYVHGSKAACARCKDFGHGMETLDWRAAEHREMKRKAELARYPADYRAT
jgi:hypothetical protein